MKHILIVISILNMTYSSLAQENADKIIGTWFSKVKEGKVLIYKNGDEYFGKLIYLKNSMDSNGNPVLDSNNPDSIKRKLPLVGVVFLTNFIYDAKTNRWKGKLYDYDGANGNTYDSFITIEKDDTLNIKGFWGLSFFGLNRGLTLSKVKED
ncbi:SIGNAL peptide protein [Sphingobacteriaceae bacterium]|nr:SIGNAL peptide protein [Sphingobacteriaceae bacterium]